MKTKNNNFRVSSGIISMVVAISLLSINISAQTYNSAYAQYAMAGTELSGSIAISSAVADADITSIEMEDWMVDPASWIHKSETVSDMLPAVFMEETMEIESWMTNPDWTSIDENPEIEKWMTTPGTWVTR